MDANYKDMIRQMIAPYFVTLSHLFEPDADYSGVDYLEQYDEEWGTSDANYTNRFRVLLAISWSEQRSEPEFELLIRHLLIQEIIDRETNSFQGAGDALHLALFLLKTYGREEDEALFIQAKEANFDTFYSVDLEYIDDNRLFKLDELTLDDCIRLANELAEKEYEHRFIELWIAEQTEWSKENLTQLRYWEQYRGNLQGEIAVLRKLEALYEDGDVREYCMSTSDLCRNEIEAGEQLAAWNTLQKIIPRTIKDKSWYCDGLGREIMEICADLIIFYGRDHPVSTKIWAFAENGISKSVENMGLILYDKTIKASKLMGNDHLAQRLTKHRKKLEQR